MKNMFICFKMSSLYSFVVFIILIIAMGFLCRQCFVDTQKITEDTIGIAIENSELISNFQLNEIKEQEGTDTSISIEKKEEYKTMPRELKGNQVIGKIKIPKIDIEAYILSETNKSTLSASATKLYGPKINQIGNFCIAGHNYNKIFGKIKDLEAKDEIILTDTFDNSVTYEVYDNFQTSPEDVSCLNQNTEGDRELTLITCTKGALKRIIIKAVEVYD